jgi:uncharacterized protein
MKKEFLPYKEMRNNAIKLAHRIYLDGFTPDVIYVSLRGGAYLGNIISEYFKAVRRDDRPVFYAAVVARSYTDIRKREKVMVDGWTYDPAYLRNGDKILLVDDIFDSGRTMNHLAEIIMEKGIPREDLKITVYDYKILEYLPIESRLPLQPDYYCRKHQVKDPAEDSWIHYSSHELIGLTSEELAEHYFNGDDELKRALECALG